MKLSLVVPTLGRTATFPKLLDSLAQQTLQDFELIVADQNPDDRLVDILRQDRWPFPIHHVRTPGAFGISRARNAGLKVATGEYILFPDDDCWYPTWFLQKAVQLFKERTCAAVTGRAADLDGRSINGRYQTEAGWIDRRNIWITQIEWVVAFRRDVLVALGGYDESIGVGAGTPWGASEGQDVMLRLLAAGHRAYFDPSLYGHHPELDVFTPTADMTRKGRSYARGMGYVLRQHGFNALIAAYWMVRPAVGAALNLLRGRVRRSVYQWNIAVGRFEGWTRRCLN